MKKTTAIILAAGKSTRMKSKKSKLLHKVAGKTVIKRVAESVFMLNPYESIFVLSHQMDDIVKELETVEGNKKFADQGEPRGTGHAVIKGLEQTDNRDGAILVIAGDIPLIKGETLLKLQEKHFESKNQVTFITMMPENPYGYGRVIRDSQGNVLNITEQSELKPEQLDIKECNSGIYMYDAAWLNERIGELTSSNSKGELFLTDLIEKAGGNVGTFDVPETEVTGVNTRYHLSLAEKFIHKTIIENHMINGVSVHFPETVTMDESVKTARDVEIEKFVTISGETVIEEDVFIGQGAIITDSVIKAGAIIKPYSVIENSIVGENAQIGPFAHLRPLSNIGESAKVGNFVEIKKSVLEKGVKASHLSYLGDSEIGEGCNIGAGTITCNYDGKNKHKTVLGKNVFVGSDSQIIAPCVIGDNVYIGSGTTVMKDVPAGVLVINPKKQIHREK